MEYLTVKEVAELKGCSVQYIKKLAHDGKIESVQELNPSNNCMQYKIPISALPDELKGKYYGNIRSKEEDPPELKPAPKPEKQRKNTVNALLR